MKMTARIEFLVYRLFHLGLSILIAAVLLGLTLSAIHSFAETETPARAATNSQVLNYLYSISGTKTVSGQHNDEPNSNPASCTNWIYSVTGKYPGLWGGDFLYSANDIEHRGTMIDEAKNQWNNGTLVTLMWHVCPPTVQEPCSWADITSTLTYTDWNDLVMGGDLNTKWKERIDTIVPYLQSLKCSGVEVLWRPLHEMNADWCWWCGRPGPEGSRKLYTITYEYMTYEKGLTNLIWVWNIKDITPTTTISAATSVYTSYYPGDGYVDVVSLDPWNYGFTAENYSATLIIANGKPIAIGETSKLPSPSVLAAQPRWTWFLGWAEWVSASNTITEIRAVYNDPRVVNRGEMEWEGPGSVCVWLPLIVREYNFTNLQSIDESHQ
jgi:mannan endo-1,4-beta-mannosidase